VLQTFWAKSRSPGVEGFERNGVIVPGPGVGTGPGFSGFGAPASDSSRYLAVFVVAKYSMLVSFGFCLAL
jgi:hypothetical protein